MATITIKKLRKQKQVMADLLDVPKKLGRPADTRWVAELMMIQRREGGLCQPSRVLEYARNPKAALHSKFQWDDTKAGHQWRLLQARQLMRVAVYYEESISREIPVFVSIGRDRNKPGGGYRSMAEVLTDEEMRSEMLEEAKNRLLDFRQKYQDLHELAEVFQAIDRL